MGACRLVSLSPADASSVREPEQQETRVVCQREGRCQDPSGSEIPPPVGRQVVYKQPVAGAFAKRSLGNARRMALAQGPEPLVTVPHAIWPSPTQVDELVPTEWVYYCGVSPLPQSDWSLHSLGPIFVISLFDGIGAAFVALLALGLTFRAVAVETDPIARKVSAASFRNVVHYSDVREFRANCLRQEFVAHEYAAILVIGGSPCQDISQLNMHRRGLHAPRTRLFAEVPRVAQECRDLLASLQLHVPVLQLLENVAKCPADVMEEFCHVMAGRPLAVHASSFGWVRRTRLFWGGMGNIRLSSLHWKAFPVTCVVISAMME